MVTHAPVSFNSRSGAVAVVQMHKRDIFDSCQRKRPSQQSLHVAQALGEYTFDKHTLQVTGKRGEIRLRLPLPQDVGDVLLRYLDCRPANIATDRVFMRSMAPCRPFASRDGILLVVKHALKRAHLVRQPKGAHLLRHTAATEM